LATADTWLGVELSDEPAVDARERVIARYLAAFGPATVRDVQAWSGLTRVGAIVEELRPRLRSFRDEHGSELFDLPDAPRPDPDTPAPPRFLPEYDNLLLSHADRTRFITGGEQVPLPPGNGARYGTLLVDGVLSATWRITTPRSVAVLEIHPFRRVGERDAIVAEGERLLSFVVADAADRQVRFAAPAG
jgi:hypothetical protein